MRTPPLLAGTPYQTLSSVCSSACEKLVACYEMNLCSSLDQARQTNTNQTVEMPQSRPITLPLAAVVQSVACLGQARNHFLLNFFMVANQPPATLLTRSKLGDSNDRKGKSM